MADGYNFSPRSCVLPKPTEDKHYIVNCDKHSEIKPGEYVEELSLLTFSCNPGFTKDYGDEHFQSFCLNSTWIPAIPSCTSTYCHVNAGFWRMDF